MTSPTITLGEPKVSGVVDQFVVAPLERTSVPRMREELPHCLLRWFEPFGDFDIHLAANPPVRCAPLGRASAVDEHRKSKPLALGLLLVHRGHGATVRPGGALRRALARGLGAPALGMVYGDLDDDDR